MGLDAVRQRDGWILLNLRILCRRIPASMTAGHHPEHVIVVERDVPLQVARTAFDDIIGVTLERCGFRGIEISVPTPVIRGAVVADGAAHEHHLGRCGVGYAQQGTADAVDIFGQPGLDT